MKRSSQKQSSLTNFVVKKIKTVHDEGGGKETADSNTQMQIENLRSPTGLGLNSGQNMLNTCNSQSQWDIGLFIGRNNLDDLSKQKLLKCPWTPPKDYCFPVETNRNLRFQISWLSKFSWLTYTQHLQGALCRHCVLFAQEEAGKGSHQQLGYLVTKAYTNWKKALEHFSQHANTTYHKKCSEFAENFLRVAQGQQQPILNLLSKEHARQDEENRVILGSIVETVILCGRQELALRGKHDAGNVMSQASEINDGNFRTLLRFRVQAGDSILEKHIESGAKNAMYTSPKIQNQIIDICGDIIQEEIVRKVNKAKCFSVLVDETTDIRTVEQLSLCVRWLNVEENKIHEDFVTFTPVKDLTGQGLAETITAALKHHGIHAEYLIGQGYDGASSMSGYLHGAQAYVRKDHPMALYVHCSAHSLNLALADSCSLATIRNCIGTIQSVGSFFRISAKNTSMLKDTIKELLPSSAHSNLLAMCETRWVYKHEAVLRFKEMYEPIVQSLLKIQEFANREASQKAHHLYCAIIQSQFVVALNTLSEIFSYTLVLCKFLQSVNSDLAAALRYVDDVVTTLDELRENTHAFNDIYKTSSLMLEKVGEEIRIPRIVARSVHRGNIASDSPEEHFKKNLYLPFLDHVRTQLKERFQKHKSLITAIQKIIPAYSSDATVEELRMCVEFYKAILPEHSTFEAEFSIWKNKWMKVDSKSRPVNVLDAFAACDEQFFPNVKKLLQVLATLPVSTATPERTFSTLRRLKTYLRNSMGETRLTGLALLSVHRSIQVKTEEVVSRFMKMPRRISLST